MRKIKCYGTVHHIEYGKNSILGTGGDRSGLPQFFLSSPIYSFPFTQSIYSVLVVRHHLFLLRIS